MIISPHSIYSSTKPPVGTQIDWTDPLSQGLVGCWLFNEGGGGAIGMSKYGDRAVNQGNGYLNNAGVVSPNTTSGMVASGNALKLSTIFPYASVFAVVGISTLTNARKALFGSVNPGSAVLIRFGIDTNASDAGAAGYIQSSIRDDVGNYLVIASSSSCLIANSTNTVALVQNGFSSLLYANGKRVNTTPGVLSGTSFSSFSPFSYPVAFGCSNARGTIEQGNTGNILKTIFIYNRALSASEIQRLHELTKGW